jgi:hypothetical protein
MEVLNMVSNSVFASDAAQVHNGRNLQDPKGKKCLKKGVVLFLKGKECRKKGVVLGF